MKPERALIAERPIAQHCAELLAHGNAAPEDLLPSLAKLGDRLTRALSGALAPLCGGDAPALRCAAPRECTTAELTATIAPLAANCLMAAGEHDAPLLASLEAAAVLRIVDRAFGGRGDAPSPLPEAFPLSAELMIRRLETVVAGALGKALATLSGADEAVAVHPLRRDGNLALLSPFATGEALSVLTLDIEEAGQTPWQVTIAMPRATLAALLGHADRRAPRGPRNAPQHPVEEPFGDLLLGLGAVLVDMNIPFSTLSALQPGQILPVAVARSIPLKVGGKTIAHGTIGAMDDRVAVQITQAF